MKKKVVYGIILSTIIIIGIVLFSYKIQSIRAIKDIKQAIIENESLLNVGEENITIIDVTNLEDNGNLEHEHIYINKYDETKHWEECKICKQVQKQVKHNLITTWTAGKESCQKDNSYTKTCLCGYMEKGHKPCVWKGTYGLYGGESGYTHVRMCSICNDQIMYSYYRNSYGNGQVYLAEYDISTSPIEEHYKQYCYDSANRIINCNNLGTCQICQKYRGLNHELVGNNGRFYCRECNTDYGTCSTEISNEGEGKYTIINEFNLINGASYNSINGIRNAGSPWETTNSTVLEINSDKTKFKIKSTVKFKNEWKEKYMVSLMLKIKIGNGTYYSSSEYIDIYPDIIPPEVLNITTSNSEWSKNEKIKISGIENYCDTVKIEILDEKQDLIYEGGTNVINGNYSVSCIPDIETNIEEKTFTAIVTDACNNSTSQEFTLAKIDGVAPHPTSETKIEGKWAKSKNFTFKATDEGIGNVQIAFNDIKDLASAHLNENNEYSREYEFTGDVYSPKELSVLYKDELGNTSIQKVTINKLDNTAPRITNARIHNNKLTVEANDIKEGMGEGSGVAKYRYIASAEKINNPEVPETTTSVNIEDDFIIPNIDKVKYIYIVAEDVVRKCK